MLSSFGLSQPSLFLESRIIRFSVTYLIDWFIDFMNKESVHYSSILEYISDACSEIDFGVETIHSELNH